MLKKNEKVTIRIEDLSKNGEGIGRADGFAVFVKDTVPGDLVEAGIMKLKKQYGFARLLRVLEPSPDRTEAPCRAAGRCGGCQLQAMKYERQLELKEKIVREALERIGGFRVFAAGRDGMEEGGNKTGTGSASGGGSTCPGADADAVRLYPIVPSDPVFRCRNKMIVPVAPDAAGKPAAGFYARHSHTVIPCSDCLLGPEESGKVIRRILDWMKEKNAKAYRESDGSGLIRHIFLRKSRLTGRVQLCLIVNGKKIPAVSALKESLETLKTSDGAELICGACFSENTKNTNVIFGKEPVTLWGDPVLEDGLFSEKYGVSMRYRISPMSFYQVNPGAAEKIYEEVLSFAGLTGKETVFDLYCGTGTISLFLASAAARVIGVEAVPAAVRNAEENARLNGCTNVRFVEGRAEEAVPELLKNEGLRADVVVVDPPRKGCAESLLQTILAMEPEKIIYVSCDPATLARDLKILAEKDYRLEKARPYDQFVMGMHVETVVLLTHRLKKQAENSLRSKKIW